MKFIEMRDICQIYLGEIHVPVLKAISMSIEQGELMALMEALGIRQEHFVKHPGMPRPAHIGEVLARWGGDF